MFENFCATLSIWVSAIVYAVADSIEDTFEQLFE